MSLLKNGWHPSGDKEIHKATWKKDLMSIGRNKNADSDRARSHVSTPLQNLKDPDSFGPPPKHSAYYPNANPSRTSTGGSSAAGRPTKAAKQEEQEEVAPQAYSVNTTGLRTDNLPLPPGRRDVPSMPTTAREVPPTPTGARPVPPPPPRTTSGPPPVLPPRQSENPSEYDPPPPPTYGEALQAPAMHAAASRLGQGMFSLSTGSQSPQSAQGHTGQLSELQQRFARMNTSEAGSPITPSWKQDNSSPSMPSWKQAQAAYGAAAASPMAAQSMSALASQKKKPPPPPKKPELAEAPPPIPMSSKPRPG